MRTLAADTQPLLGIVLGAIASMAAVSATLVGLWLSSRQKRRDQGHGAEQFTWQRMRELLEDTERSLKASQAETGEVRAELAASEERCAAEMAKLRERIELLERGNPPP